MAKHAHRFRKGSESAQVADHSQALRQLMLNLSMHNIILIHPVSLELSSVTYSSGTCVLSMHGHRSVSEHTVSGKGASLRR